MKEVNNVQARSEKRALKKVVHFPQIDWSRDLIQIKMADKDVEEKTIAEDLVVTKYKMAGEIVNSMYYSFYILPIKMTPV